MTWAVVTQLVSDRQGLNLSLATATLCSLLPSLPASETPGNQLHPELPFPDNKNTGSGHVWKASEAACSAPGKAEPSPCMLEAAAQLIAFLTVPGGVQLCLPHTRASGYQAQPLRWAMIWSQTLTHTGSV